MSDLAAGGQELAAIMQALCHFSTRMLSQQAEILDWVGNAAHQALQAFTINRR